MCDTDCCLSNVFIIIKHVCMMLWNVKMGKYNIVRPLVILLTVLVMASKL